MENNFNLLPNIPVFDDFNSNSFGGFYESPMFGFSEKNPAVTYGFTLSGSTVTAMSMVVGSSSIALKLPSNATFSVSTTNGIQTITETLTGSNSSESIVYKAQSAGSSAYSIASETTTFTTPSTASNSSFSQGYSFTTTNGVISGLTETTTFNNNSHTTNVLSPASATFVKNSNGSVTETVIQANSIQSTNFVQSGSSTFFTVNSTTTQFIQPGTATTLLDVNPNDQLSLTFTGNAISGIQAVSSNGVKANLTLPSSITFEEVTAGKANLVEEVISHNSNTSFALYLESGSSANYTEIAHGSGSTIDLVGIQAQLNQIPAANLALL